MGFLRYIPNTMDDDIKSLMNGQIIIVAPEALVKGRVPLYCPLCEFPNKTSDDSASFRRYGCCAKCEVRWVNWQTKEIMVNARQSPQWSEYIEERTLLSRPIFTFN